MNSFVFVSGIVSAIVASSAGAADPSTTDNTISSQCPDICSSVVSAALAVGVAVETGVTDGFADSIMQARPVDSSVAMNSINGLSTALNPTALIQKLLQSNWGTPDVSGDACDAAWRNHLVVAAPAPPSIQSSLSIEDCAAAGFSGRSPVVKPVLQAVELATFVARAGSNGIATLPASSAASLYALQSTLGSWTEYFEYDAAGRLRKVTFGSGGVTNYALDNAGNRTNVSSAP